MITFTNAEHLLLVTCSESDNFAVFVRSVDPHDVLFFCSPNLLGFVTLRHSHLEGIVLVVSAIMTASLEGSVECITRAINFAVLSHDCDSLLSAADVNDFVTLLKFEEIVYYLVELLAVFVSVEI